MNKWGLKITLSGMHIGGRNNQDECTNVLLQQAANLPYTSSALP